MTKKPWVSDTMKQYWEDNRDAIVEKMRNREHSTGIDICQTINGERDPENYRDYQREYQKQYRQKHPDYYRARYKTDRKVMRMETLAASLKEIIAVLEAMDEDKLSYYDTLGFPVSAANTLKMMNTSIPVNTDLMTSWDILQILRGKVIEIQMMARDYREHLVKERAERKIKERI